MRPSGASDADIVMHALEEYKQKHSREKFGYEHVLYTLLVATLHNLYLSRASASWRMFPLYNLCLSHASASWRMFPLSSQIKTTILYRVIQRILPRSFFFIPSILLIPSILRSTWITLSSSTELGLEVDVMGVVGTQTKVAGRSERSH
nr:uncharacterized protein LOC109179053 [Ipomoea batatas]